MAQIHCKHFTGYWIEKLIMTNRFNQAYLLFSMSIAANCRNCLWYNLSVKKSRHTIVINNRKIEIN